MKLIDAKWPLSPREADTPAWDSLSESMKDRFDYQMAVYAAMIEAIDTAVGTLVKGIESRGLRDNTLIFFMSDNGANAESGPDGRFNGDPPGGPNSDLYLGMNWAALGNTPFRRFKHFTHEGGISSPLIMSWPKSVAGKSQGDHRTTADSCHRCDVDGNRGYRREVSERFQRTRDSSYGRNQSASGARRRRAQSGAAAILGARRQPRRAFRQLENCLAVPG
jgi:hypothetical protein